MPELPVIFAGILVFAVVLYVLMDGFDLGIGILFPFARSEDERDLMMNTVAPVWDGNETWLVLGGSALFGAFPLAYSVILPALYLPLTVMLLALIFRGVAFEFRFKAGRSKRSWGVAFAAGSMLATLAQGIVLGAFIQGFEVVDRDFAGGIFDWLTPFSLLTGVALLAGYALLGATWLAMKTEDELQEHAFGWARIALFLVIGFIAVVSVWTPLLDNDIARRWFSWPNILYLSPVPVITALVALWLLRSLAERAETRPFLLAMTLFLLSFAGLGISLWPSIIPPDISIFEAAAPPETQIFLLVGLAILMPIVLAYTAYAYWVFRGKVRGGYH